MRFDDDGETTGIGGASHLNDKCKMINEMFDLQGREVRNHQPRTIIIKRDADGTSYKVLQN
jgi:hypothetical protein